MFSRLPHLSLSARPNHTRRLPLCPLALALCLVWLLAGCGLLNKKGEMAAETMPKDTAAEAGLTGKPIPYKTSIVIQHESRDVQQDLKGKMEKASNLVHLAKKEPDSLLGLESRARDDQKTAVQLLHSQGYYDGEASFVMDGEASPATVTLTLTPRTIYTLGRADVSYDPEPRVPDALRHRKRSTGLLGLDERILPPPHFPAVVPDVEVGKPVTADAMLAAVEAMIPALHKDGYPLARVSESRYTLDREKKLLNADIVIDPGPPTRMGAINVLGNQEVNASHVRNLSLWESGVEPWDDNLLEDYANGLRTSGLFRTVTATPAVERLEHGADGMAVLPVDVTVAEAPFRTLEASAKYDTDTGFGVEGAWEHRNVFGNGEKFRVTAPINTEVIGLKTIFEKPAFLAREQTLLAHANALQEKTEAFEKKGVDASVGLERRLTRHTYGGFGVAVDAGTLKDGETSEKPFGTLIPQLYVRHDSRNDKLHPVEGSEVKFAFKPFTGYYEKSFSALAGTVSGSAYYTPLPRKNGHPNDAWVLAGRVEGGGMMGSSLHSIPSSMRYYAGGAGSVRGYTHQSIGPRARNGDPLGGRSYQLVSVESRFKITENLGFVPFLDGGMAYKDELPRIVGDMNWGAGVGLRYFTPIGPLRLDVAKPLQPKKDDPPVQIYISVGQSF